MNPNTVSLIETEEKVWDIVYSQSSGLIYGFCHKFLSGFKWDEMNKTFNKQFETSIQDTTDSSISSITLAPPDTSGGDQIYVSVGFQNQVSNVYRLGGRELEKRVLLADTSYIDDKCWYWILASNSDRHILLINPDRTPFIYIHVKEQKHGKVNLNQLKFPVRTWLLRIELIGQLLILGEQKESKVYMCELIVTESDAFLKPGSNKGPILCSRGSFAVLSQIVGHEDEQLHVFTVRYDEDNYCTYISEYRLNTSVSGSDLNQLPSQPIHTLKVEGKFRTYCFVNVNSYSSVLIGSNGFPSWELNAVELFKQ